MYAFLQILAVIDNKITRFKKKTYMSNSEEIKLPVAIMSNKVMLYKSWILSCKGDEVMLYKSWILSCKGDEQ